MAGDGALHVSLEEFGLSRYEALVYVALLSEGEVSAAELSYASGVPRTKVYPTLHRLEKKGLVVASNGRPQVCTPVAPEDAFDGVIQEHISRVDAMNTLVAGLKRLNDESRQRRGSRERRYVDVAAPSTRGRLAKLIGGAKESVRAMVGHVGASLLAECGGALAAASQRGVSVRIIMPAELVGTATYRAVSDCGEVRASGSVNGCVVFDGTDAMFVDGAGGRSAVIPADGAVGGGQSELFERVWEGAASTDGLADMTGGEVRDVYAMVGAVGRGGGVLGGVLGSGRGAGRGPDVLGALERASGVSLAGRGMDDVVEMVDTALRVACSGRADLDGGAGSVSIRSPLNGGSCLPWAAVLDGWLAREGYRTRTARRSGVDGDGEAVYIRFAKG